MFMTLGAIFSCAPPRGKGGGRGYNEAMSYEKKAALIELWEFARARKKLWLIPLLFVLGGLGLLLFLVEGTAVSPFVYTLF